MSSQILKRRSALKARKRSEQSRPGLRAHKGKRLATGILAVFLLVMGSAITLMMLEIGVPGRAWN